MSDGAHIPGDRRVSITSQGCKINQYEGAELRAELRRSDWSIVPFGEPANVVIINTCTVTSQADFRARNLVRRARRANPQTRIVVTGCYAQTNPEALEAMGEVDLVVGNREKLRIPSLLEGLAEAVVPSRLVTSWDAVDNFEGVEVHSFAGRSRGFLKIQDGCNQFCSFCIIPIARGRSRSRDPDGFRRQVARLRGAGFAEIVLTGIHLGQYGLDLTPPLSLAGLIRSALPELGRGRIRLSSTEVNEVTDELIELVAEEENLCPHFHVPLQCADDELLRAMNRPYDSAYYARRIERISASIPRFALGADVIVGFPGETDERFERTERFIRDLPFTYLHVFPYSARPGTAAALLPGRVDPGLVKERGRRLRELGRAKTRAFARSGVGRTAGVALETWDEQEGPKGLTEDYCHVRLDAGGSGVDVMEAGGILPCEITRYEGGTLRGRPAAGRRVVPSRNVPAA